MPQNSKELSENLMVVFGLILKLKLNVFMFPIQTIHLRQLLF